MEKDQYERKISGKQNLRKAGENLPYSKNFKYPFKSDERDLLHKRQLVTKLSRKDLEDKYIDLCDENFFLKRQCNECEERIKFLTAKIIRMSECHRSYSTSAILKDSKTGRKSVDGNDVESVTDRGDKIITRASSLNSIYKKNRKLCASNNKNKFLAKQNSTEESTSSRKELNDNLSEKLEKQDNELSTIKEKLETIEKDYELQKELCSQLQREKNNLEHRLSEIDLKKFLIENIEVNRLKRKLEHFREVTNKLKERNCNMMQTKNLQIQAIKAKNSEIAKKWNEEQKKNFLLAEKLEQLNSSFRVIESLKKQISELEYDKKSLAEQRDSLSVIVKETTSYNQIKIESPISKLTDFNVLLEKLEELETEKAAIEHSKNEMFHKIRFLQDLNDKLSVDLEGFKAERGLSGAHF